MAKSPLSRRLEQIALPRRLLLKTLKYRTLSHIFSKKLPYKSESFYSYMVKNQ